MEIFHICADKDWQKRYDVFAAMVVIARDLEAALSIHPAELYSRPDEKKPTDSDSAYAETWPDRSRLMATYLGTSVEEAPRIVMVDWRPLP